MRTNTAADVMNLPVREQLHVVRHCQSLWNNLTIYCYPEGDGVDTVVSPGAQQNPQVPESLNTISASRTPFPDAHQQVNAIDKMFGWYVHHNQRRPAAMTSEPSVQDEVHLQIIEPTNMVLEVCITFNKQGSLT